MSDFDKLLNCTKRDITRLVDYFPSAKLELHKTETMFGTEVIHLYLVDKRGDRVILQKHIVTIPQVSIKKGEE